MRIVFDSEAELEKFILDRFDQTGECVIDGECPNFMFRQLNLGIYGIADIVTLQKTTHDGITDAYEIKVFELKKEKITAEAFAQVSRYEEGLKRVLSSFVKNPDINCCFYSCLVGCEIDDSCLMLNNSDYYYYKVFFDPESGVAFESASSGWGRGDAANEIIAGAFKSLVAVDEIAKKYAEEVVSETCRGFD